MKNSILGLLAVTALLTACSTDSRREQTQTYPAPDTTYVQAQPQDRIIILPGYYGAAHYDNPTQYYADPQSAYNDPRSSAYHHYYTEQRLHEQNPAKWQTLRPSYRVVTPTRSTSATRTYAAPRPTTTTATRTPTYSGFSATPSRTFTAPSRPAVAAPAARTYSAPAVRTYSAPAPVRTYSAPAVHSYSAPAVHTYSAPHISVSAHH